MRHATAMLVCMVAIPSPLAFSHAATQLARWYLTFGLFFGLWLCCALSALHPRAMALLTLLHTVTYLTPTPTPALAGNNAVLGSAGGDGGDGNGNTANGGDFNSGDFSGNGGIAIGDNGNGGAGGNAIGGESDHCTLLSCQHIAKSTLLSLIVFTFIAMTCC